MRLPLGSRGCRGDARALRSPAWCSITSGSCGATASFHRRPHPRRAIRPVGQAFHAFPKPRDPQRRRTTPSTPRHRHPGNPRPPAVPNPLPNESAGEAVSGTKCGSPPPAVPRSSEDLCEERLAFDRHWIEVSVSDRLHHAIPAPPQRHGE